MPFTNATLRYLRALERNNNKPWFEAHRAEYEGLVKAPMLELIGEMDVRLAAFAPEIIGDVKRSMFRIYRDIRFSKDKTPYKTHASFWLYHRDGSRGVGREASGGGAGFYFQIAPGDSYLGGGIWMPPREALQKIRERIAEKPVQFERVASDGAVKRRFGGFSEEAMLTRVPRGFAADHPAAHRLRLQSFTLGRSMSDADAVSGRLADQLARDFRLLTPLVRWVNETLGLEAAKAR